MVREGTNGLCTTCNSQPGERTTVTFLDAQKAVDVWLCEDCHLDFSAHEGIELTLVEE